MASARRLGWPRWEWIGLALAASALGLFLSAPGGLVDKAHVALHGLCAQIPSHTLLLGGARLPFDARMTGLYLGALCAGLPLALGGRRGVVLSRGWLALLVGFVVIVGLDGLNSVRVDLGWPGWWPPSNELRLVTGLLGGVSLGVMLAWLLNLSLWPTPTPLLRRWDGLAWLVGGLGASGLLLSGAEWALVPMSLMLVVAAVLAVGVLNLALLALFWGVPTGQRAGLARLATVALAAALVEMSLLAGARFMLEAALATGHG